jgi:hypothetical protein
MATEYNGRYYAMPFMAQNARARDTYSPEQMEIARTIAYQQLPDYQKGRNSRFRVDQNLAKTAEALFGNRQQFAPAPPPPAPPPPVKEKDPRTGEGSGTKPLIDDTEVTDGTTTGGTGTNTDTGPSTQDMIDAISTAVSGLSTGFGSAIEGISTEFAKLAGAQDDRMAELQKIMLQSQVMNQQRPEVAGVKTASGSAGNLMQIARRGVSGAFGRKGMRISGLNV